MRVQQLPDESAPAEPHTHDQDQPEGLQTAIRELASELGGSGGRLGLLLPDGAVRVHLLSFESLPENARDSDALVRWRLKDFLPYPSQEARVTYEVVRNGSGPVEVLALAARSSVVAEYEALLEPLSGLLTLVLPATAALLPLLPSTPQGQLLLHASGSGLTSVAIANERVALWRHEIVESQADFPTIAAEETARALASAQDYLKIEIEHVWLYARPPAPEDLATSVQQAIGLEVNALICPPAYTAGLGVDEKDQVQRYGMPFAGLIANG